MMIKAILSLMLAGLASYAARNARGVLAPVALFFMVGSLVGIFFVWNPQASSNVANLLGVGRGADLIFYFGLIFGLFSIFVLHLRMAALHRQLTVLTRELALRSVREQPHAGDKEAVHAPVD